MAEEKVKNRLYKVTRRENKSRKKHTSYTIANVCNPEILFACVYKGNECRRASHTLQQHVVVLTNNLIDVFLGPS